MPHARLRALLRVSACIVTVAGLCAPTSAVAADDLRLVEAAKRRDWAAVASLSTLVNVNAVQPDGATALLWAAQWDHVPSARLLVAAGADANAANEYGVTPLVFAATNGSLPMVEALLTAGAKAGVALPNGETVLMTAARTGRVPVVAALLARGADVNAQESYMGQSALAWAISEQHTDVVRSLIEAGADVRQRSKNGFTALLFAARHGNIDVVRMLMARGADVHDTAKDGTSVLHMATVRGHVELAELLLDAGADPNASAPGFTPLHWAAGTWESATNRDYFVREWAGMAGVTGERRHRLLTALLAHGANPNARARFVPRFGSSAWKIHGGGNAAGATPLFYAASVGDAEVIRRLVAAGADPGISTFDGTTPLIAAAGLAVEESETKIPESRHLEAVKLLIDLGADVHAVNRNGDSALHGAAFLGYSTVAQLMVDRGVALNAKNKQGQTPYRIAAGIMVTQMFFSHPETARLLKSLGGVE